METFGERLQNYANNYKSNSVLAEKLGIHPNMLSDYIRGVRKPGLEKLTELAQLGCDINWLLTGQSYKSPEAEEMDKKDRERLDKLEKAVLELSETNSKLLEHLKGIDREQRNFRGKIKELENKNGF